MSPLKQVMGILLCIHLNYVLTSGSNKYPGLNVTLKGVLHPKPKLSLFCMLSQNYKNLFENLYKLPEANDLRGQKWH